ncbi:MAG: hypothetical protein ACPHVK_10640, partial [Akkermansiaceae bacterium]
MKMAKTISRYLLAFFGCLSLICSAHAQEPPNNAAPKGNTFTVIALSAIPYENIYYRKGEEYVPIELRNGMRSQAYALGQGSATMDIFTDHDDEENPYKLVGRAPLVSGTSKMLFFIGMSNSTDQKALPLVLYGLDDSRTAF